MAFRFGYGYCKLACPKCGRRILVEWSVNGTEHTMGMSVVCADCIEYKPSEEFIRDYPKAHADIEAWIYDPTPHPQSNEG